MPDTFLLTTIFILGAGLVGAFVKGRSKDKCLKDYAGDLITLELKDGKSIWGKLFVESTGLEFLYPEPHQDDQGHLETSYIYYRHEFSSLQLLVRYHDELSEHGKKKRIRELQKTYHPNFWRRMRRRIINIFKTVRDAVVELLNMFIDLAKKRVPGGAILQGQDKYVNKMKQEIIGSIGTAYEPLFERHIGKRVVVELQRGGDVVEYPGILKDYSAEFIEIIDVDYGTQTGNKLRKVDLILPRTLSIVRHLAE